MYRCKYFKSHELVCPVTYKAYADRDTIYNLFDENTLRILDMIREWSGVGLSVNNWHWGGRRTQCGYRLPQVTVGAAKTPCYLLTNNISMCYKTQVTNW
jgi:hypothetical protein